MKTEATYSGPEYGQACGCGETVDDRVPAGYMHFERMCHLCAEADLNEQAVYIALADSAKEQARYAYVYVCAKLEQRSIL